MKKILILGKGYIGNYLANAQTNDQIIHLSKKDLDYSDYDTFDSFLKKESPDWIINSSGYTGKPNVDSCENDKENCFLYNVKVPMVITDIANNRNIPIVHIGSGCVYSGYEKNYSEQDSCNFGEENDYSSFYSKTKSSFERLSSGYNRYILRIRIPFNCVPEPKNYIHKLLSYDNLINKENSLTCVDDLIDFVYKFIEKKPDFGLYNVVNEGSITASHVVSLLKQNGLENPNWRFVSIEEANFKVQRSNCILSTEKIKNIGLELPNVKEAIEKAIKLYKQKL
jgi:dTDP-4-dehydrorhamnose reductase